MRTPSTRCRGFTLVELVISIVLIGILAAVGAEMIADSFTTTRMVNAENSSTAQARYALERLAREIREVKYDSSGGNYCITTKTATNLVFYKTSGTYNSTCATNVVTVTINYSNPNLTLQYSSPAAPSTLLSSQASSFTLAYLQSDGVTSTTSNSYIRFVVITLTVTDATSGQSVVQRTRVALRNT